MSHLVVARDAHTGREETFDFHNNTVTLRDENGRLVKLDLGPADVHVDVPLATYAVGYMRDQKNFIADIVAPVVPVDKASDKYFVWDKDDTFTQAQTTATVAGGNVQESTPAHSVTSYSTIQHAWSTFLPTEVEANADSPLQLKMRYTRLPVDKLTLARELRVHTMVTTAASYGADFKVTLAAGEKWNGGASSDPIANIHDRMLKSLKPITGMAMSEKTYFAFQRNAQVQKYIASKINVKPINMNPTEFAALLELPPITIGREKWYNPTTSAYDYIWGNDVVLFTMPKTMPPMGDAISWNTFRWKGGTTAPGVTVDGGMAVRSFFQQERGTAGGTKVIVYHQDAEQFVADNVSGLIINAYQ